MTLIAAFKECDTPVLLGDLVVSEIGRFAPSRPIGLPTRDDVEGILPREWCRRIVGTCQKVYKINDHLAVGWCGHRIAAKPVVEALRSAFSNGTPRFAELHQFLEGYHHPCDVHCILIGWLIEDGRPRCFRWESSASASFSERDWAVEGSGKDYFTDLLLSGSTPQVDEPHEGAIIKAGLLLCDEVLFGTNLWNLFGGGVQLIYYKDNAFHVLKNTVYVFSYAIEKGAVIKIAGPARVIKCDYENELVAIQVFVNPSADESRVELHCTDPIYEMNAAIPRPSGLEADYWCVCVEIASDKGFQAKLGMAFNRKNHQDYIRVFRSGEKEAIAVSEKLFREVLDLVKHWGSVCPPRA